MKVFAVRKTRGDAGPRMRVAQELAPMNGASTTRVGERFYQWTANLKRTHGSPCHGQTATVEHDNAGPVNGTRKHTRFLAHSWTNFDFNRKTLRRSLSEWTLLQNQILSQVWQLNHPIAFLNMSHRKSIYR